MAPRSDVWKYFIKNPSFGKCKECSKTVKTSGGNTKNLWNHINRHHPQLLGGSVEAEGSPKRKSPRLSKLNGSANQSDQNGEQTSIEPSSPCASTSFSLRKPVKRLNTIQESFSKVSAFGENGSSTAKLNQALLHMIAKTNSPLRIVENEGFLHFCKIACPLYKVPSRKTVTKMLDNKFDVLKEVVCKAIANAERYSLTCDVWTDSGNNKSYLGMTIHFLENGKMRSIALAACPLEDSHTKIYLASKIRQICKDWGIDLEKVTVMVTDGGANIVAAAREVFGEKHHLICVAHTLSRMTTVAIEASKAFGQLLSKVRAIVGYFKKSVNAADELWQIQLDGGTAEGELLKLKKDEPTRWGSTFVMLERFITLADTVGLILLHSSGATMLTGSELSAAKEARDLLQPIAHVITELEGEQYSLSGMVIPMLKMMKKKIDSLQPSAKSVIQLKSQILEQYTKRFDEVESADAYAIATLLDPRFKAIYFSSTTHARVLRVVLDNISTTPITEKITTNITAPSATGGLWDNHDQMVIESTAAIGPENSGEVSIELDNFLNKPVVSRTSDALHTWETIKSEYPQIFPVAQDYLTRMVTSVPSERLFSTTGKITKNRYRLNSSRMSKLAFLASISDEYWSL